MTSLLKRIIHGDEAAVEEFYRTYAPQILRFIRMKVATQEDAQELCNDVFFDAIDSLGLFEEKSSITTWLYQITRNKIVDYYRKRKIKTVLLSQLPFLALIAQEIHQPEFIFEKEKIKEKIESTLHALSERYQHILRMHYEDDIPVKEIAIDLHLSFKATESLLFRARKAFQSAYERE